MVRKMLSKMGLELNKTKIHFIFPGARQSVMGLTVNEKVSAPICGN